MLCFVIGDLLELLSSAFLLLGSSLKYSAIHFRKGVN